jgi:hypothetical protein
VFWYAITEVMLQAVEEEAAGPKDPTKFSGKKSKATAKKGQGSTQWDILCSSGIPAEELPKFRFDSSPLSCIDELRWRAPGK